MAQIHTHYDNLKVTRNAPPEVIRAAYKTLSQKFHPDRNPGNLDATRTIQIINLAYEVLSDPVKRKEHDEWIAAAEGKRRASQNSENDPYCTVATPNNPSPATHRRKSSGFYETQRRSASRILTALSKTRINATQFFKKLFWYVLATVIIFSVLENHLQQSFPKVSNAYQAAAEPNANGDQMVEHPFEDSAALPPAP
jgi:curved DNA-binding protein CbpA